MPRRAFSLIEATLSIALVGMMASAALAVVAGARRAEQLAADRARAQLLADELLAEIAPLPYKEPGSLTLGPDAGESSASRTTWDDIDDADGHTESPPKLISGTAHPATSGWTRSVTVKWVDSVNLLGIVLLDSGVKRITVTVAKNGRTVLRATLLRSADRESFE